MRLRPTARLAAALLLAVPLALAGCAELQKVAAGALQRPHLTFRSASLDALDLEGATVGFHYDLENPNGFGVSVARLGYAVEIEGKRVASGDLPGGLEIRASGTAPVTFPVRVRFRDVPGIVSLIGKRDRLPYRLSGTVGVKTPLGVLDLPLSHEDTLALPRMPDFAIDGLSIRSVGLDSVALDVRVAVRNPNGFAIPAGRLDYALSIGGSPVATGDGRALQAVAANGGTVVSIPVRVSYAGAGRAAADVARGGAVDVALRGTADVGGVAVPLDLAARLPARR
jgi:LEA14-like dessication related protein